MNHFLKEFWLAYHREGPYDLTQSKYNWTQIWAWIKRYLVTPPQHEVSLNKTLFINGGDTCFTVIW